MCKDSKRGGGREHVQLEWQGKEHWRFAHAPDMHTGWPMKWSSVTPKFMLEFKWNLKHSTASQISIINDWIYWTHFGLFAFCTNWQLCQTRWASRIQQTTHSTKQKNKQTQWYTKLTECLRTEITHTDTQKATKVQVPEQESFFCFVFY